MIKKILVVIMVLGLFLASEVAAHAAKGAIYIDSSPVIRSGRVYAPLRFSAELLVDRLDTVAKSAISASRANW
jgi:hypothetical protein